MNADTTNVVSNGLYAKWQTDGFSLVSILHFHACFSTSTADVQMYEHTYGMHETGNAEAAVQEVKG